MLQDASTSTASLLPTDALRAALTPAQGRLDFVVANGCRSEAVVTALCRPAPIRGPCAAPGVSPGAGPAVFGVLCQRGLGWRGVVASATCSVLVRGCFCAPSAPCVCVSMLAWVPYVLGGTPHLSPPLSLLLCFRLQAFTTNWALERLTRKPSQRRMPLCADTSRPHVAFAIAPPWGTDPGLVSVPPLQCWPLLLPPRPCSPHPGLLRLHQHLCPGCPSCHRVCPWPLTMWGAWSPAAAA